MNAPLIGARVPRKEDYRFLTGTGQYTDDFTLPHQTYAAFVRSPHAHARIKKISSDKAMKSAGVLAVYTGADLAAARSAPVKTARTPGDFFALSLLMLLIRACACGERTKAAYVCRGSATSSVYWPEPVRKR